MNGGITFNCFCLSYFGMMGVEILWIKKSVGSVQCDCLCIDVGTVASAVFHVKFALSSYILGILYIGLRCGEYQ